MGYRIVIACVFPIQCICSVPSRAPVLDGGIWLTSEDKGVMLPQLNVVCRGGGDIALRARELKAPTHGRQAVTPPGATFTSLWRCTNSSKLSYKTKAEQACRDWATVDRYALVASIDIALLYFVSTQVRTIHEHV